MMGAAGAEGLSADAADGVLAGLMEGAASRSPEGMSAALDRADAERANGEGGHGGTRARRAGERAPPTTPPPPPTTTRARLRALG